MFTLCGLILEARENLFRNFWSPFSISFYFSSERNNKKNEPTYGPCPTRTPARGGLYKPRPSPGEPQPPQLPTLAVARSRRRRRPPPRRPAPSSPDVAAAEVRRRIYFRANGYFLEKKIGFRRFFVLVFLKQIGFSALFKQRAFVRPLVLASVRRFSFSRIKSAIFLIAIPDPIFVLV